MELVQENIFLLEMRSLLYRGALDKPTCSPYIICMDAEIQELNNVLSLLKVKASCVDFKQNQHQQVYDLSLKFPGKVKDIEKFSAEIALALKKNSKPTISPVYNKGIVQLEFFNQVKDVPNILDYTIENTEDLQCLVGHDYAGNNILFDIKKAPHTIISGTTGSGKSVLLHVIIANLIVKDIELSLLDPKGIEFSDYKPYFTNTILHSVPKMISFMTAMVDEMEVRFSSYTKNNKPIVIVIDEFADILAQDHTDQFRKLICRLAQKSRAANMHLIMATQRPSASMVDSDIKANFPARIACKTASVVDSRLILNQPGAEKLFGRGDAYIHDNDHCMQRFQSCFVDPKDTIKYLMAEKIAS